MVKGLHRVAHAIGKAVDIVDVAHHSEAVAHLQREVGAGEQVEAGTVHAGDIHLITHAQA